jgi:hypothetical protein
MAKKKKLKQYSYDESLAMLSKLQQMAIDEGNINLALKAEELKCKIAAAQAENETDGDSDEITKILVDFINDKQSSKNTKDICAADDN